MVFCFITLNKIPILNLHKIIVLKNILDNSEIKKINPFNVTFCHFLILTLFFKKKDYKKWKKLKNRFYWKVMAVR